MPKRHSVRSGSKKRSFLVVFLVAGAIGAGLWALGRWYLAPPARKKSEAGEPALIDRYLPRSEFNGRVAVDIHASPAEIFQALREVTLDDMPLARLIGEVRYLPGRLLGQGSEEEQKAGATDAPFLDLVMSGSGNIVLAEEPDREMVLGSIGKYHDLLDQQIVPLENVEAFETFEQPDYQKLVMSFRITGDDPEDGCRLVLDHRTHGLSPSARRKFALYWLGIKPGGNFVSWLLLRAVKRRAEAAADRTT